MCKVFLQTDLFNHSHAYFFLSVRLFQIYITPFKLCQIDSQVFNFMFSNYFKINLPLCVKCVKAINLPCVEQGIIRKCMFTIKMSIIHSDLHPLNLLTGFVPSFLALATYSLHFVSTISKCLHIPSIFYNLQGFIMVQREGQNVLTKQ